MWQDADRCYVIILNSWRLLAEIIIPLLGSSGNLLEDCCLTCATTELIFTSEMLFQCKRTDFKKWGDPSFWYVRSHSLWVQLPDCWQTNPTRFVLCRFHRWFFFFQPSKPIVWVFSSYVTKHLILSRLSSTLVRIFWPYWITETAFAWCKH